MASDYFNLMLKGFFLHSNEAFLILLQQNRTAQHVLTFPPYSYAFRAYCLICLFCNHFGNLLGLRKYYCYISIHRQLNFCSVLLRNDSIKPSTKSPTNMLTT